MTCLPLVFTDLDGTLLDHHTYSFAPAQPLLEWLTDRNIPVIPATSKTSAELLVLRNQLGSRAPFLVENGAAIYLPKSADPSPPPGVLDKADFWVREFVSPRQTWIDLLAELSPQFSGCFISFTELGATGIAELTGLTPGAALLASQRQYSEPITWQGSDAQKRAFCERVTAAGGRVLQGGRFMHISGNCDKGEAMNWLVAEYVRKNSPTHPVVSIAAGDSENDRDMLELADIALVIPSPVHQPLELERTTGVYRPNHPGPVGWASGIKQIMDDLLGDNY